MSSTPSVTRLNNYLQDRRESHLLSWGETSSGASHCVKWHIECKIKGVIKGTGTGPTKGAAKQIAAEEALQNLKAENK